MIRTFVLLLLFLGFAVPAQAASLYISPSTSTYKVGDTVTAIVYVESTSQAMNAVSGTVAVSGDVFDVVSATSASSIVNFWVSEPRKQGNGAFFEGVVLNPGYTGSAGRIATLTLRAKKAGSGSLSFSSATILANDGQGTNLLAGTRGATYTIVEGPVPPKEVVPKEATEEKPTGPDVTPPVIDVFSETSRDSKSDPTIRVRAHAKDPSGVASYEFSLDGGAYLPWEDPAGGIYSFHAGPGAHTLSLRVVDSYGNEARDYIIINVIPLQTPRIISYPDTVVIGEKNVQIAGDAVSGINKVTVTLSPQVIKHNSFTSVFGGSISAQPRMFETEVSPDGTWSINISSVKTPGQYLVTVTGHDARGASSFPSTPVSITFLLGWFMTILSFLFSLPMLLIIILLLIALLYIRRKRIGGAVGSKLATMKKTADTAFATMRRNIQREERLLAHRDGADKAEEKEMLEALEENVTTTEKRLDTQIEQLKDSLAEER